MCKSALFLWVLILVIAPPIYSQTSKDEGVKTIGFDISKMMLNPSLSVEKKKKRAVEALQKEFSINNKDENGNPLGHQILLSTLDPEDKKELVIFLIENALDLNGVDSNQQNLLHLLAVVDGIDSKTRGELVQELISRGVDIRHKDVNGDTPVHLLLKSSLTPEDKYLTIAPYLIHGYNVNLQDESGRTPLHIVSSVAMPSNEHRSELIKIFVLFGTNLSLKDKNGKTALDLLNENDSFTSSVRSKFIQEYYAAEELHFRKLLGNSFGLRDQTELLGLKFSLEGLYLQQSHNFMTQSANKFYHQLEDDAFNNQSDLWQRVLATMPEESRSKVENLSDDQKKQVREAFAKTDQALEHSVDYLFITPQETAQKIENGDLVAMKIIASSHLLAAVAYKKNFYVANKGYRQIFAPGVVEFQVEKPENIVSVINDFRHHTALDESLGTEQHTFFGQNTRLQRRLGASEAKLLLRQQSQKSGNCALVSSSSMELVVLYVLFEEIPGVPAEDLARAIKTVHRNIRRETLLGEYLNFHRPNENPFYVGPDYNLIEKIATKETTCPKVDQKRKEMVIEWLNLPGQNEQIKDSLLEKINAPPKEQET